MPRIKQNASQYIVQDFQREIRMQQGYYNLMSTRALAAVVGIPHNTLNPKLRDPRRFTVANLQKIVPVLHPNPEVVLALLGYSKSEIKRFKQM